MKYPVKFLFKALKIVYYLITYSFKYVIFILAHSVYFAWSFKTKHHFFTKEDLAEWQKWYIDDCLIISNGEINQLEKSSLRYYKTPLHMIFGKINEAGS